ncbi:SET domain-containing protein [Obba rivulosa]|uniref:SET domain-containing protein n=1 Tax=Obba rivulosa TaxID=1052685 RepID=A0A8E2DTS9_9APHY|nr:SET domain-containing protein [Obba rivulosa]
MGAGATDASAPSNDAARWGRLLQWLKDIHGMDTGPDGLLVECKQVEGAGRGLFASKRCLPSTTLFTIPAKALINVHTLKRVYPTERCKLSATQMISLHLLLHRPEGDRDSFDPLFGPYISTLPRDFASHPLSWLLERKLATVSIPQAQLLDLLSPSVSASLSTLENRFWEDWRVVCNYLKENLSVFTSSSREGLREERLASPDHELMKDFLWAWLNVNTRCIYYRMRPRPKSDPDNMTLCPILDFANHHWEHTQILPIIDSDIWAVPPGRKVGDDFQFLSTADCVIEEGQELFLQYGHHSNRTLMTEYGFVNRVSAETMASGQFSGEVDVQDIVEALFFHRNGSLRDLLRTVLEDEGYWGDWTLHSSPLPAHPSYRLISALRLYHALEDWHATELDDSEPTDVINKWRDVVNGQAMLISDSNETQWRGTVLDICESVGERARRGLQQCEEVKPENVGWWRWAVGNIGCLWREELEVAQAVGHSIRAGEEF